MNQSPRDPKYRTRGEYFALVVDHRATPALASEFTDELAIVSALRRLGADAALEPATRERIRARILTD